MAGSVNKVMLVGNVGQDPDIRQTNAGKLIANLSMATSESWRDKNTGERKEKTEWHRVVIFNEHLAKICQDYVKKGSKIYVEGKQKTRKWTNNQGNDQWTTEVVLENFSGELTMLSSSRNGPPNADSSEDYGRISGSGSAGNETDGGTRDDGTWDPNASGGTDDEIPF